MNTVKPKKPSKPNVDIGTHDLIITGVLHQGGVLRVICKAVHHDKKEIFRNFTQGSDALKYFYLKLTGKELAILTKEDCNLLKGKIIRAEIGAAKNPEFVNIIKVNWVYKDLPAKCSCITTVDSQSMNHN